MKLLQTELPINKNFGEAIDFKFRHFIVRYDGTLLLKYLGDACLIIVVIKFVHVVLRRDGDR